MKKIIVTALIVSFWLVGKAQTINITGAIEDRFLEVALPQVRISVLNMDSTVVVDSAQVIRFVNGAGKVLEAHFYASVEAKQRDYLLRATLDGYGTEWQKVSVTDTTAKEINVPAFRMHKVMMRRLGEAVVKATRIKMFFKGDTLIYDASAFKLPDGSMLNDLIRQMPGVTMNDGGEIFVNGRKVDELLLGSRSFMKGNKKVMLENLPYYTVKNIKVYEKLSDRDEALGTHIDQRNYVMDVNLKNEYNNGYIANVEAAGGTNDRWLGRAFLLGFTDNYRLTLFGNANNVNESRHIGQSGQWTPDKMPLSLLTTRSVAAELSYQGKNSKRTLTADYTSSTDEQQMRRRYEQFVTGAAPLSLTESGSHSGDKKLNLKYSFDFKKPFFMGVLTGFSYAKHSGRSHSAFDQWNDTLTASMRSLGMSEGKTRTGFVESQSSFKVWKEDVLEYYTRFSHSLDESKPASRYATRQFSLPSEQVQYNANDISNRNTTAFLLVYYTHYFKKDEKEGKDIMLRLGDEAYSINTHAHDYLYHPDTLLLASQLDALQAITDPHNSYVSRLHSLSSTAHLSISGYSICKYPGTPLNIQYRRWGIDVDVPVQRQSLRYQRGALDTLARQTPLFVNTAISFQHNSEDGRHEIRLGASYKHSAPELLDRITYRDDSAPLVVKLGNPDLKNNATSHFNADYSEKFGKHGQQWHVGASLDYQHRAVAQSVTYNATSGVYTYKPKNVDGAYILSGKFDFSQTIDNQKRWTWQSNADADFIHSVDYTMLVGETESRENKVNTLTLHDNTYLQYNKDALNLRATADFRWRHSEGRMRDFSTLNAYDFRYGLTGRYTLPRVKTTLSADAVVYSRRGYGSAELNTNDFVVNASVSQSLAKGKLILGLEAFDVFHQLSSTQYEVNAQGRTETWYRSLPHYVMLHAVYHWNKSPRKR